MGAVEVNPVPGDSRTPSSAAGLLSVQCPRYRASRPCDRSKFLPAIGLLERFRVPSTPRPPLPPLTVRGLRSCSQQFKAIPQCCGVRLIRSACCLLDRDCSAPVLRNCSVESFGSVLDGTTPRDIPQRLIARCVAPVPERRDWCAGPRQVSKTLTGSLQLPVHDAAAMIDTRPLSFCAGGSR